MTTKENFHLPSGTKLVVCVLQTLLRERRFTDHFDLVEALKCRCATLRIPYGGRVHAALDQLERGGRTPIIPRPVPRRVERPPEPVTISREAAARIVSTLLARRTEDTDAARVDASRARQALWPLRRTHREGRTDARADHRWNQ